MNMTAFETFEHQADIGIRGFGSTVEEAFEHAAMALYSVMVNLSQVENTLRREIVVAAPDHELLLVEWLNGLLAASGMDNLVFSRFQVTMEAGALRGTAWGEPVDLTKHETNVEVKGATYHRLSVMQRDGRWCAECVVDV